MYWSRLITLMIMVSSPTFAAAAPVQALAQVQVPAPVPDQVQVPAPVPDQVLAPVRVQVGLCLLLISVIVVIKIPPMVLFL